MPSEMQLDAKAQRHVDAYLNAVAVALARSGQTQSVIQGILSDIRTQVFDMLRARAGDAPTEDDVCAVIAQLDPPESYAEGTGAGTAAQTVPPACGSPVAAQRVMVVGPGAAPAFAGPSGKATTSLILGLLGFLTCGLTGIPAIVLGLMAQGDIRRSGGRLGGGGTALMGIIMGAISLVTLVPSFCTMLAIALPNFFEAQTRAKVARTGAELRTMQFAIEVYRVDTGTYPARIDQVTTPVAYIARIPVDIFVGGAERYGAPPPLGYAPCNMEVRNGRTEYHGYIVLGNGPDCEPTIDPTRDLPPGKQLKADEVRTILLPKIYDPTNGTNSAGDIVRLWEGGDF